MTAFLFHYSLLKFDKQKITASVLRKTNKP